MKSLFFLLLAGLAIAAPTLERDLTPRQSPGITFNSITASGPGCPPGSYTATLSPSLNLGTIAFRQYSALLPSPSTRDCTVTLRLTYPSGCTSGSLRSVTHGFAQVSSGVTGRYTTSYSSSTGNSASPPDAVFSGPLWAAGSLFTKSDVAPAKVVNRSPNSAAVTVTVNTKASLGGGSGGNLTPDDITFSIINQSVNSDWRNCT